MTRDRNTLRRLAAASLVVAACGCGLGREASPESALVAFVGDLDRARLDPAARRAAYEHLSARARGDLQARASRASQVSGWALHPWDMIAPGRIRWRIRFDRNLLRARVSGDRAVVTAQGLSGGVADVPMVREGGRWLVDLDLPPMQASDDPRAPAPPR
ncbi:MAG: hypothetical protein R3A48_16830 [Polyangiales bacterium]